MNDTTSPTTTTTTMTTMPMAVARAARLALPVGDADTLLVLEALCGHRRAEIWEQPPTTATPSPTLSLALARATAVGLLRFIAAQGGERDDEVLRDPVDNPHLAPVALSADAGGLSIVVSLVWAEFIWRLSTTIMPLSARRRQAQREDLAGLGRTERQHLRTAMPSSSSSLTPGDHVALAMAVEHADRLGLPDALARLLVRSLASASPLAALYQLDDPELGDVDLAVVVKEPVLRAFELVGPGIGRAIARQVDRLRRHSHDADEVVARANALSTRLRRLLALLDTAGRLDLAVVLVDVVIQLPTLLPVDTRATLIRLSGVVAMSDRDRVITAVAGLFTVVDQLDTIGHVVASSRYGDERWHEARLVRGWLQRLREQRPAIETSRQALVGAVG